MAEPDGGRSLVAMLTAGAAGAVEVDFALGQQPGVVELQPGA
jgi:hypothetical protein